MNPVPWIRSSASFVSGLRITRYNAVTNHRPPSSAGIGKTFITASVSEIIAAIINTYVAPAFSAAGKMMPKIASGPATLSPTAERFLFAWS